MPRIIFTVINDLVYDQRMQRICTSLSASGYDVLLTGRKLKSSVSLEKKTFTQKRLQLAFNRGKLFYIEYNIRLLIFLLFQKADIICGIDLDTIIPCYIISKIKEAKCVYDAHELFPEVPEVINRPLIKKIWLLIERYAVKRIHNCYTVSFGIATYFKNKYGRDFGVIRNVPLLEIKEPKLNTSEIFSIAESKSFDGDKFIFYQGALNLGRGLEQLIIALKDIPLNLKISGEGDLSDSLRELVKKEKLHNKVTFLGMKKPGELRELTKQSFIGLNLLENLGMSYYLSLANKFFDYVHAQVPQISMNYPEYEALNAQFKVAVLIDNLETLTIVNALNRLINDKEYYFRLRENCIRASAEWNWQKEEVKLVSFYRNLK
ncbi:MAG: glycosyltransferase [Chitinophagales bacterium]|nr:glycosyltransferase [Chitinophagales bacterium]